MRCRVERAGEPGDEIVRAERVRVERTANAEGPGQRSRQLHHILRKYVYIHVVERLRRSDGECFGGSRRDAINKLRKGRIGDQWCRVSREVVIVQPEPPGADTGLDLVLASRPGKTVVQLEA